MSVQSPFDRHNDPTRREVVATARHLFDEADPEPSPSVIAPDADRASALRVRYVTETVAELENAREISYAIGVVSKLFDHFDSGVSAVIFEIVAPDDSQVEYTYHRDMRRGLGDDETDAVCERIAATEEVSGR